MKALPFDIKKTGQIVVFIGIQASGKTTFYNQWLAPHGYVHVNLDTLPLANNGSALRAEMIKK